MRSKAEMIDELRGMLNEMFVARTKGVTYARLARAHGYVDGYMRGMVESGAATREELLSLVTGERAKVGGPATGEVRLDQAELRVA